MMNDFFRSLFFYLKFNSILETITYHSGDIQPQNRAFLFGDAVKVSFFVHHSKLIMAEECYFFLMASMRKMRMPIPLTYTLEFFQNLFQENAIDKGFSEGIIQFLVYRNTDRSSVSFYFEVKHFEDILTIQGDQELDLIKELNVNTHFLSTIRTNSPENIYAEIYAKENDLDDVIFLNPNKRIARSIFGNLLFLEGNVIKIPKTTEGAYISPLMENFVTFVHNNKLAEIQESEMIAFESQKAEEILLISEEKGVFSVKKIRNKTFEKIRFTEMIQKWKSNFI